MLKSCNCMQNLIFIKKMIHGNAYSVSLSLYRESFITSDTGLNSRAGSPIQNTLEVSNRGAIPPCLEITDCLILIVPVINEHLVRNLPTLSTSNGFLLTVAGAER